MGADEKIEAAKRILEWLTKPRAERMSAFTARDCWQAVRGRFQHMAEVQAGLDVLEERVFIAKALPPQSKAGRPSQKYLVNPEIFGGTK
jgi:hypothetical protein